MRDCILTCSVGLLLAITGCRDGASWQLGRGGEGAEAGPVEAVLAAPPRGASVHLVRVIARGGRYAFEPAEVHVRPGDIVRFVHTDRQPQAVAFELEALSPEAAQLLVEQDAATGPLLAEPGALFEVHFRDAPEGTYPFRSLTHGEQGMRGAVIVGGDGAPPPAHQPPAP